MESRNVIEHEGCIALEPFLAEIPELAPMTYSTHTRLSADPFYGWSIQNLKDLKAELGMESEMILIERRGLHLSLYWIGLLSC